jgi:hypothetical protein
MGTVMRNALSLGGAALLAVVLAAPAGAQEGTVYATGSVDGNETGIGLVGVSVRGSGFGLKPVGVLQGYYLQYTVPATTDQDETINLIGFQPQVGLGWYGLGGSVEGRVGYNLVSGQDEGAEGDDVPVFEGEGGGSGFTTTVQAQTWATRPELFGLATYNWGEQYLYTQAQALVPLGRLGVGAEAVWQQQTGAEGNATNYQSTSFGPVVRLGLSTESSVTFGGGYKDDNVRDPTWYARLTFVRWGIGF